MCLLFPYDVPIDSPVYCGYFDSIACAIGFFILGALCLVAALYYTYSLMHLRCVHTGQIDHEEDAALRSSAILFWGCGLFFVVFAPFAMIATILLLALFAIAWCARWWVDEKA